MTPLSYQNDQLYLENCAVADLVQRFGTPLYIYSRTAIETQWQAFAKALSPHPHLICYSVKANSNLAILNILARLGSGFDIVSIGELERVLAAGGDAKKIVFSGVGKQAHEIERALSVGIHCFNVESMAELNQIEKIARRLQKRAPISLRINPDVDAKTHRYISTGLKENKFGIDNRDAFALYLKAAAMEHIEIIGIDCHIGSQLTTLEPFLDALTRLFNLVDQLAEKNIHIKHVDLGGGLGVRYREEEPPAPAAYVNAILEKFRNRPLQIILEPGRAITANAGALITQVIYLKHSYEKDFAIVDAAMNDLLRPALYEAWQDIIPVKPRVEGELKSYDIVGPVCETGDWLGQQRPLRLQEGDLLAIRSAGAYGFVMSSNYNSRPRVAEVMVDKNQAYLIRQRETISDLFVNETLLPL